MSRWLDRKTISAYPFGCNAFCALIMTYFIAICLAYEGRIQTDTVVL